MIQSATIFPKHFRLRIQYISLSIFWFSGLLLGFSYFSVIKPLPVSMMRSILCIPVSIVGLSFTVFLPLVISYFSLVIDKPFLALLSCFLKAISFGFTYACLTLHFHSASWLMRFLFMFSDSISSILLIVLCCNCFNRRASGKMCNSFFYLFSGLLILFFDCILISPLLIEIF